MREGIAYHLACRSILATGSDDFSVARRPVTQGTSMIPFRPSRRQVLRASVIGGIAVYLAPLGSGAFASLLEERLLTRPDWNSRDGALKYRIDGTSKVTGEKVFARDIRARDMPHWPQQQSHALVLRATSADRGYAGFDLAVLGTDLPPDRVVTAADLVRDGLAFPDFYGEDMPLPEGRTPAYLGQAVAILIYHDFARFRFAKQKLQFNDAVVRYGAVTGPLRRDPWGASRFVRVGGKTPYDEDAFSCFKQGPVSPRFEQHEPVWPEPARDGDVGAQGMYYAKSIDDELVHPPADWLVLTRDYATQSGDTAALEPDNANGWYDADKEELHLVVATQSPQEVAVARKQAYDAAHPGKYYGVGFGCIQRRFGNGAEASLAKVELAPDGRITLSHSGAEIGTGASSGQAVACARWLGRPADALEMAVTEWTDLPVETSGDPYSMSQAEQDRLANNPRWSPTYASASSASNSSYYLSHTTRAAARVVYVHGLLPSALAIWARGGQGHVPQPEAVRWSEEALTAEGLEPLPLARLAQEAHARGLVVGAAVHAFNRWQWAAADFMVDGASVRKPVDGLSVRYGGGAGAAKQALATTSNGYQVLDRRTVSFPPTRNNNAMLGYNTAVGTLAELAVDASNGKVALLTHHTILECGNMLVPELVSSQIQGGTATGIGLALHEQMPLYEDGPGNGTWNFNRYHLPRGSDVAVWAQTADILPPLSDSEPPKGMAEVVMIPIMAAIVNGIAHAIGHRFRTLPVTPDQILKVLG
jgi:CO/xanthine dehydrogenase Mo-binding subunit